MRSEYDKLTDEIDGDTMVNSNPNAGRDHYQYNSIIKIENVILYLLEDLHNYREKNCWLRMCLLHDIFPNANPHPTMKPEDYGKYNILVNNWIVWLENNKNIW